MGENDNAIMELRQLYAEIARITREKCGVCLAPYGCCAPDACEMVEAAAYEDCIELPPKTGHPMVPFMGAKGCILEPYQRPICAIHTCERHLWGDPAFRVQYFELRARIEAKDFEIYGCRGAGAKAESRKDFRGGENT